MSELRKNADTGKTEYVIPIETAEDEILLDMFLEIKPQLTIEKMMDIIAEVQGE